MSAKTLRTYLPSLQVRSAIAGPNYGYLERLRTCARLSSGCLLLHPWYAVHAFAATPSLTCCASLSWSSWAATDGGWLHSGQRPLNLIIYERIKAPAEQMIRQLRRFGILGLACAHVRPLESSEAISRIMHLGTALHHQPMLYSVSKRYCRDQSPLLQAILCMPCSTESSLLLSRVWHTNSGKLSLTTIPDTQHLCRVTE